MERILSVFAFFVSIVCFIYTLLSVFTLGQDVCSGYQQGLDRVKAQRDQLQIQLDAALRNISSPNI